MNEQDRINDLEGKDGYRSMELTVSNHSRQTLIYDHVDFAHGRWKDGYTPPETIKDAGSETFLVTSKQGEMQGVTGDIYLVTSDSDDPITIYFDKPFGAGGPECKVTLNKSKFDCVVTLTSHKTGTDKYKIVITKKG